MKMVTGIVTLFYILGVLSAADAVMNVRTPQGTIAWSVSLVSFPFVAVPAYWALSRSDCRGHVEAYQGREDALYELVDETRGSVTARDAQAFCAWRDARIRLVGPATTQPQEVMRSD